MRLTIRNRSRYATAEVRELVKFATSEVDMRGVCVNVKNSTRGFRGMAYEGVPYVSDAPPTSDYLVTVGIPEATHFPLRDQFYGKGHRSLAGRFPKYDLADWRECLVAIAAHEAKHIEQFKENKPRSEIACEAFAVYMLGRYRTEKDA